MTELGGDGVGDWCECLRCLGRANEAKLGVLSVDGVSLEGRFWPVDEFWKRERWLTQETD